ncbi:larval cuticle protein 4 [Ceratitis capitata]|uniref:(Mediterranean fruit fly) hypothetical protein n=1 Tax=Ceratitis capitata TaxID=7213 RepID=W8BZ62_CERCA|nr:larval cuticle protein 4 [Ceratitis capitata]CAD7012867.1 unnamed protein product [Ceratitis capitata]
MEMNMLCFWKKNSDYKSATKFSKQYQKQTGALVQFISLPKQTTANMFKYVLLFACIAYAAASGADDDAHAEVTLQKLEVFTDGFNSALETTNHIHVLQAGDAAGNIKGDYSYVSPEGENIAVSYVADESGYHPQSELLPTAPPTPAAILKALEYIAAHPSKESKN